jgi:anti-anti-sigma factor
MTTPPNTTKGEPASDASAAGEPPRPSSILLAAGRAIAGATSHQELIEGLAGSLSPYAVDICGLARFIEGTDDLEIVAAWNASGAPMPSLGMRSPRAAHPAMDLVTPDAPFISDDCASDPRLGEEAQRRLTAGGMRSFCIYPLVRRGELFGGLWIGHRTPRAHTPADLELMGLIAQLTAVGTLSVDGRDELARQIKRANAIYRSTRALSASPDEGSLLTSAAELMVDEIGFVGAWIGLVDEEAQVLRERAMSGPGAYPGHPLIEHPLTRRDVAVVEVTHTGQPVIHLDALKRADAEGWGHIARAAGLRSFVAVPLSAGDKVVGAMGVGRREGSISEDELSILSVFGNQLATTLLRLRSDAERLEQVKAIEEAYASQARLLATVRELSTPVIPVHDGVLVVPLVGALDARRSAPIMEALLNAIQKDRASVVILDVTGVPAVDTAVADHLLRSTRAAALLGAKCVLVGMSPVVARTLVELGVDMSEVTTRSNLQAGIAFALSLMSLEIRPIARRIAGQ